MGEKEVARLFPFQAIFGSHLNFEQSCRESLSLLTVGL